MMHEPPSRFVSSTPRCSALIKVSNSWRKRLLIENALLVRG